MHKYAASEKTKIFHINLPLRQMCKEVAEIDVADMIYFDTEEEAEESGYKPCKLCVLGRSE